MRARKRERSEGAGQNGGQNHGQNRGQGGGAAQGRPGGGRGKSGNRRGGSKANRGRQGGGNRGRKPGGQKEPDLWGDSASLPARRTDVRITDDPAAVPRSLGKPPLPGHEVIAEHYFGVVYERAVMTAGALAAAGGLIDHEALTGDGDDT